MSLSVGLDHVVMPVRWFLLLFWFVPFALMKACC